MEKENKFILNLTRLSGSISAITIDCMFETLAYIDEHAIIEAQFIEANYLGSLFNDDEIMQKWGMSDSSLKELILLYEEAKKATDDEFDECFTVLRQKHKYARKFLEFFDIQNKIRLLIDTRKKELQYHAACDTVKHIIELLQHFPHSDTCKILAPLLPEFVESISKSVSNPTVAPTTSYNHF